MTTDHTTQELFRRYHKAREGGGYGNLTYADLLASVGLTVLDEQVFGSYQGDIVFLVSDGERTGILIQGYGSCSGCDALEAAMPYAYKDDLAEVPFAPVAALAESMKQSVVWATAASSLADALEAKLDTGNDWWRYAEREAIDTARALAAGDAR